MINLTSSPKWRYGLDPSHKHLAKRFLDDRRIGKFDITRIDQEFIDADYFEFEAGDGLGRTNFNAFTITTPERNRFDIRDLPQIGR